MAYHSRWSDEDGEFVGYVDEFPSLSWLAPTQDEAIDGNDTPVDGHTE